MKLVPTILAAFWLIGCTSQNEQVDAEESTAATEIATMDTLTGVSRGTLLRVGLSSEYISERPLDIWLPSTYDGKRKHAVLYMFDGQMLFDPTTTWNGQEWRVDETLDSLCRKRFILPTVVVAMHNGGAQRNFEYFPQAPAAELQEQFSDSLLLEIAQRYGSQEAFEVQSDAYLKYLVEEVKPLIEANFRVYKDASATAVMGSSMGGLMSMYALGEYPEVFGAALCMSTHWPGGFAPNEQVPNTFLSYMKKHYDPSNGRKIYFDHGTETLDGMYEPFQKKVDALLLDKGYAQGEQWVTKKFPGAAHDEKSWASRLHHPLLFAFAKQR